MPCGVEEYSAFSHVHPVFSAITTVTAGKMFEKLLFFADAPDPRDGKGRELAIVDVSKATSVISEDVIDTMTRLGMLKYADGEHRIVATPVRDATHLAAAILSLLLF